MLFFRILGRDSKKGSCFFLKKRHGKTSFSQKEALSLSFRYFCQSKLRTNSILHLLFELLPFKLKGQKLKKPTLKWLCSALISPALWFWAIKAFKGSLWGLKPSSGRIGCLVSLVIWSEVEFELNQSGSRLLKSANQIAEFKLSWISADSIKRRQTTDSASLFFQAWFSASLSLLFIPIHHFPFCVNPILPIQKAFKIPLHCFLFSWIWFKSGPLTVWLIVFSFGKSHSAESWDFPDELASK